MNIVFGLKYHGKKLVVTEVPVLLYDSASRVYMLLEAPSSNFVLTGADDFFNRTPEPPGVNQADDQTEAENT